MTDQINTGGAAFPCENSSFADFNEGMTLRDYFAAKALSRMADFYCGNAFDPINTAKAAYEYADAMLAARGGAL